MILRDKRPLVAPQTRHLYETVRITLDDPEATRPIVLPAPEPSDAVGQRGYWQRVAHRYRGLPLADWLAPRTVSLVTWPRAAPPQPHTIRRWMRRRTHQAFAVGAISIVATVYVGYVLVASLVTAVLADALLFGAALIGGGV